MTNKNPYSKDLIQAINNWQRGGSSAQKKKRGAELNKQCQILPQKFKESTVQCFRQIALDGKSLRHMGTKYKLGETLSSWTECVDVAKDFKGGVPPVGYQGIIITIKPSTENIIVNLNRLFEDKAFQDSVETHKSAISGFASGMGRYQNSQKEIVIEIDELPLNTVYAWGGYSSPETKLAEMLYGKPPSAQQLVAFRKMMRAAGNTCGANWLTTPSALKRVEAKLKYHANRLTKKKP